MSAGPEIIARLVSAPDEATLCLTMKDGCRAPWLVTFVNPYSYQLLRRHEDLVTAMDVIYADGIALAKIAALLTGAQVLRRSFDMTSLGEPVFKTCTDNGLRLGVVGAKPDEVMNFRGKLAQRFPGIRCCVAHGGYFASQEERENCLSELANNQIQVLVCGMGTPLQEQFLVDAKLRVASLRVGFSCGGFIHQSVRALDYYPHIVDSMHLRWAYRLMREPGTRRRFMKMYPRFLRTFVGDWRLWRSTSLPGMA